MMPRLFLAGQAGIIPLLNSLPGADAVVYIDFDGEVVSGTRWANGETINAEACWALTKIAYVKFGRRFPRI